LEIFAPHCAAMTKTASFGRRGAEPPRPQGPAPRDDIALTPERRALLFAPAEADNSPARTPVASNRLAATLAALSIAFTVVAVTFHMPRGGAAVVPLRLGWSLFSVGSDLVASLWATRKFCGWFGWSSVSAFFLAGAATSWAFSLFNAAIGFGDDLTPTLAIPAGGAAAAFYCLLAGRVRS
jgi:hypothetical protein